MLAVCGALLITSAEISDGNDLRPGRWTDISSTVKADRAVADRLTARVSALNAEIEQLSAQVGGTGETTLKRRMQRLQDPAGLTPVFGAGVVVEMDDAPEDVEGTDNDNDLVVHQQDLQGAINALWAGGAEAITLMGQRIISTTGIKCEGNVVTLHGIPYAPPYRIEAIGDPAALEAALDADPAVLAFRQAAADPAIRVGWFEDTMSHIEAPAYGGITTLEYARPLED